MLPGLRFVVAASVLAVALAVFGMGAAALLRTTHQVAALPPWQPLQGVLIVGRRAEETPTLSLLRVEEPPAGLGSEAAAPMAPVASVAPIMASVASAAGDQLPATASPVAKVPVTEGPVAKGLVAERPVAGEFPPPPEPVVRDVTLDVLAALAIPVPAAGVSSQPEPESAEVAPVPADEVADPSPLPAPAEEDGEAVAVAALPGAAPVSDTAGVPAAGAGTAGHIAAVPDAVMADPPLPRARPSSRAMASREAAAKRAQAAARRRQAASVRPPAPPAPQAAPFASPFGQFAPAPAVTPRR
jgi:hypothetical protein